MKKSTKFNVVELHYKRPHISELPKISSSFKAVKMLRTTINENTLDLKECFWVMLLTSEPRLLGISEISKVGTPSKEVIIREVLQLALTSNSEQIILIKNNPSGDLQFLDSETKFAKKMNALGVQMGIHLHDFIVITSEDYISMLSERIKFK